MFIKVREFVTNFTKNRRIFQYLAACSGSFGILSSGLHYGWTSPSLPKLFEKDSPIPTTNDEGSWIAVSILLGAICGSLAAAFLLDNLGRKRVIVLTSFPFFASWMMVAYAQSVPVLLLARFIAGLSDGLIFCSIPMYLAEISDPEVRGLLGSGVTVAMILGILLANIVGFNFSMTNTAVTCSLFPVLLLVTFVWLPESPYYLIMKQRMDEARRSLETYKSPGRVDDELQRLTDAIREQNKNPGRFWNLFTVRSNRRAVYIIMGLRAVQQWSGITAFAFYAQTIFSETGNAISSYSATILYLSVQLVFSGLCTIVVDRIGRRVLMTFSIIGSGFALLLVACYFYIKEVYPVMDVSEFSLVPVISLIMFVVMFNLGMQTIPLILVGELFPTDVKAFAASFADIYFCVVTTIVSKFFQFTKDEFGMHIPFMVFTVTCIFGLFFIIFCVPETKGRTLEEIQLQLQNDY